MVLVIGLSASAFASCGDLLSAMAAGQPGVAISTPSLQTDAQGSGAKGENTSIVGLWHVLFTVNGQTIQEAFQVWNAGGHRGAQPECRPEIGQRLPGGVEACGAHGTYKLAHRVWNYDTNGNFLGTINLSETLSARPKRQVAQRNLCPGFLRSFRQLPNGGRWQRHGKSHFG